MVAMVAGLLLVAAASALFATILRANSTAMKVSRLNQEIQAITDMMARDIERAGYDVCAVIYLVSSGHVLPAIPPRHQKTAPPFTLMSARM
ncbi:hypothetical protein [Aeromonas media]|uniref:hypothetical protein n=1 Tax=Aeromonas media TaxID=651 RepID=UPI0038D0D9E9